MRKIYFDTSVYVKLFTQEAGTDTANLLFGLAGDKRVQILMSVWTINEAIAAIDRKHRRKEITDYQRQKILATIIKHAIDYAEMSSVVSFVPLDRFLVSRSKDLIIDYHISTDDALHIYTAFATDSECFICQDEKLIKNTQGKISDMPVLDITENSEMTPLIKSFGSF